MMKMVVTRRDHTKKIPKFELFEVLTVLCEDYVLSIFVTFCYSIISPRERGKTYKRKVLIVTRRKIGLDSLVVTMRNSKENVEIKIQALGYIQ